MADVIHYLWRMVPAAVLGLCGYALTCPVRVRRLERKGQRTRLWHEVGLALLLMFLAGLLWLTVLPHILWEDGRLVFQLEGLGMVNLRPFVIFRHSRILGWNYFLINFLGNLVMFLPVGFFPALLWRGGRWWKALVGGFGLSLTIELCQIPISRGTDIDDLWLNTLGALLGYGLYRVAAGLRPGFAEECKVEEGPEWM